MSAILTHPFVRAPHRTLLALSLPVLFSLVAEPLTGLVDTAFVARLGVGPLAALGVGATALSSIFWIFNFLGISTQTEVAQAVGRNQEARATRVLSLALALSVGFGLLLIMVGWPLAAPIARLLGGAGAVEEAAVVYMRYRLLGAPAILITLTAFGALRGIQDMRTPLWIAVAVNAVNIALDWPLIFGLGSLPALGIAGAAVASTLAQWLGAAWALAAVIRRFGWTRELDTGQARRLFRVGGDLFVRTGLLTAFLVLSTRQANRIGVESGAAHQAIRQVWTFTALGLDALALTAQSLVGYFHGAGWPTQARRVAGVGLVWGLGLGALLGLGMWLGRGAAMSLLVPPAAHAVFLPAWTVAALAQPINALAFVTDGVHWGTGDFRFLRNAMLLVSLLSGAGLLLVDVAHPEALTLIWWVTAFWITTRAALGVGRVWPGLGKSPLREKDRVVG